MNRKLFLPIFLAAGFTLQASAQKKQFTMSEATNGMATTFALQSIRQPGWQPGTHNFYQVLKGTQNEYLVRTLIPSGFTDTVETLQKLNQAVYGRDSLKGLPLLGWIDRDYAWFNHGNALSRGALTRNGFIWSTWVTLPESAENLAVDKSMQVAYTVKNNLWLVDKERNHVPVTSDSNEQIVNGQSVHRNEFGIHGGIFFSPRGNYLAYYRMDESMVNEYPVIDWNTTPAAVKMIRYPMAGGTSHQVKLMVFNPKTRKSIAMETGEPLDQYLTSVTWSPDEEYIYIALLNRDQNHLRLNKYEAQTGRKVQTLFEEKHDKYVEPQHPLSFLPGQKNQFIWWSQRDGFMHLYLYNTSGKLIRQLTKGDYVVNELVGFNPQMKEVLITSAKESPLEKNSYAVNWETGKMRRLDAEPGVHHVKASDDGAFLFDVYSNKSTPRVSLIRSTRDKYQNILLQAADPLKEYERPEVREVSLTADDGTPLYGRLVLPTSFDPKKKYPVIVYLYNGPHVQLIKNSFPGSGNLWYEYLAQKGYIVFTMDGRGSANRGLAFEQAVFRNLGNVEMEDQLKGVEYLRSLPFVNASRMGVHGWSYGGFMTTSLMLRHPGVFKVGVAGGPVIDWSMYEVMYTERYMDTPAQNPEGYSNNNLLTKVDNLKGKLLLIHGTDDDVVVWQHSIKLLKEAVKKGKQLDYFIYPGHQHNVRGKDRVHLMQKITDYFVENL